MDNSPAGRGAPSEIVLIAFASFAYSEMESTSSKSPFLQSWRGWGSRQEQKAAGWRASHSRDSGRMLPFRKDPEHSSMDMDIEMSKGATFTELREPCLSSATHRVREGVTTIGTFASLREERSPLIVESAAAPVPPAKTIGRRITLHTYALLVVLFLFATGGAFLTFQGQRKCDGYGAGRRSVTYDRAGCCFRPKCTHDPFKVAGRRGPRLENENSSPPWRYWRRSRAFGRRIPP